MRVMIVGYGYVGSAVASIFSDQQKIIIDPKLSDDVISNHAGEKFDAVFVCVDTPKENKSNIIIYIGIGIAILYMIKKGRKKR